MRSCIKISQLETEREHVQQPNPITAGHEERRQNWGIIRPWQRARGGRHAALTPASSPRPGPDDSAGGRSQHKHRGAQAFPPPPSGRSPSGRAGHGRHGAAACPARAVTLIGDDLQTASPPPAAPRPPSARLPLFCSMAQMLLCAAQDQAAISSKSSEGN